MLASRGKDGGKEEAKRERDGVVSSIWPLKEMVKNVQDREVWRLAFYISNLRFDCFFFPHHSHFFYSDTQTQKVNRLGIKGTAEVRRRDRCGGGNGNGWT